jgi:predicted small integral membrane protein
VLGQTDHLVYPDSIFPAIQSPLTTWLALTLVITFESAAGLLAAKGVWDLWSVRKAPAAVFNGAKTYALLGCGMGIVVWLGFFAVFGGALFQMWQTEAGGASMDDAFQFFTACALVFLIVNGADE